MSTDHDTDSIYRAPTSDTTFSPQGDLLSAYVGPKNANYYARQFDKFKSGGGAISWNWPAFFIASFWLLYRKMWLNAFLYWFVMPFALSFLSVFIAMPIDPGLTIVFYYGLYGIVSFILVPMYANRLYFGHAQKKANKVASITSSAEQQAAELSRIGGTSNVALVAIPVVLVFVIGILAAIAIPAYQDYSIRAQISEGLNLSGGAKAAVTEHFMDVGEFPADNAAAGISPAAQISGKYVSNLAVANGTIIVTYGNEANAVITDSTLILEPDISQENVVQWGCYSPSIAPKHLPAMCR